MTKSTFKSKAPRPPDPIADDAVSLDLYNQPGHLIRRANQIAVGMFNEVLGSDVTPAQYAILRMVQERPGIHQVGLAKLVALDTSTTALTAARLETKGLLVRSPSANDSRQLALHLTADGVALLESLISGVHSLRAQLLEALDPSERALFVQLLRKFVHVNNEQSRAPLRSMPAPALPLENS